MMIDETINVISYIFINFYSGDSECIIIVLFSLLKKHVKRLQTVVVVHVLEALAVSRMDLVSSFFRDFSLILQKFAVKPKLGRKDKEKEYAERMLTQNKKRASCKDSEQIFISVDPYMNK